MAYIVHDSPVGRAAKNYMAMVDLAPFGFPGSMEQVWLVDLSASRLALACLPFRVYGLAYQDIVCLDEEGKRVVGVVERSGHRVFRVFFRRMMSDDEVAVAGSAVVAAIGRAGLKYEWSGPRHVAIDVPPGGAIDEVWAVVEPLASRDVAAWEWADVEVFRT